MKRIRITPAPAGKDYPVIRKGDRVAVRWEPGAPGTIVDAGEQVSGVVFDEQPDKFARYFANHHFICPHRMKRVRAFGSTRS